MQERETEVDRWKDGETHWIKQATGLHEEKKKNRQNYKTDKILILLLHFEIVRILIVFVVNY